MQSRMDVAIIKYRKRGRSQKWKDDNRIHLLIGQVNAFLWHLDTAESAGSAVTEYQKSEFVQ